MGTDLNIGHVTAYAYAKSKGYTGTEEQFATELAQFAQNAQKVAEDRAAVEQFVDEFLNTTAPAVIQDVTDEGTSQVERVAGAGTAQVTRVGQAGNAQIDAVATAGTTQIGLVTAEGTTQVTRVQDKGDEVIDSIPADYTALTEEVSDLNRHFTDNKGLLLPIQRTSFGTAINGQSFIHGIADFDNNYITYSSIGIGVSGDRVSLISSNGYNSYLFRVPYKGFTVTFKVKDVVAVNKIPVGNVGESLDVIDVIKNYSASTLEQITFNYDAGTYIIMTYPKTGNISREFFSDAGGPYKSLMLELDGVQDTFARYSERTTGTSDAGNFKLNVTKYTGKLPNGTSGAFSNNASYNTYVFQVPISQLTVKCTNGFRAQITYIDPTTITTNGYMKNYLYSKAADRVETFTANYGDWVAISVAVSSGEIDLQTDYIQQFSLPTLKLDYLQRDSFYKFETTASGKYLYIYYKSGEKYVRWELHNVPAAATNSDTWQIGHVCGLDADLGNLTEIVAGGEFELAFKEYGAADYCGGNNHGDENKVDFTLMIDGKIIDTTTADTEYHMFDRIDAVEHAIINRCDTPSEDILKHQKIWTFENGTVKVRQTLEFLETLECDFLCCMLAANRSSFTHGVRQGRVGIEDMSTATFDRIRTDENEMMYLMYGTNATAKVTARLEDHTPVGSLWINNASTLNKLYYNFYGQQPRTSVASGTVLHWESEYDIAYN